MEKLGKQIPIIPSKRGLYRHVVWDIASQILSGDIGQGDKLPTEHQLGARYGVSRTVVRDALRVLSNKGLIESRPKSGTIVTKNDRWNFLDPELIVWAQKVGESSGFFEVLLEARNTIEPQIAALAARKATSADIVGIQKACDGMANSYTGDAPDLQTHTDYDVEFHLAILEATHNIILKQFGALILAALRISFELSVESGTISERSLQLHRDVLDAIRSGDSKLARENMSEIAGILHERVRQRTKARRSSERCPPTGFEYNEAH